jgi:hypothetical protein
MNSNEYHDWAGKYSFKSYIRNSINSKDDKLSLNESENFDPIKDSNEDYPNYLIEEEKQMPAV